MNQVTLIGRLTTDPKINDKITAASFVLAVNSPYKRGGEEKADFIPCKMLGENRASFADKYLCKGKKIAVTGFIQTDKYTNKDGKTVNTWEVIVNDTEFCEKRGAENTSSEGGFVEIKDSDLKELPFM